MSMDTVRGVPKSTELSQNPVVIVLMFPDIVQRYWAACTAVGEAITTSIKAGSNRFRAKCVD